jgi:peptide/nickel transport system permease protein
MKFGEVRNFQFYAGVFLLLLVLAVMLGCVIFRPLSVDMNMELRAGLPSPGHPLGTDALGRDLLSCVIYGAGVSLAIAAVVVVLSCFTGGVLGVVSGVVGGAVDTVIMRLVDVLLAFPGILLAIALAAFFNHGVVNLILVLTVTGWVEYARVARGEVLKYKDKEFVLAARGYNASTIRIVFHHMLPLALPLMLVQASLSVSGVILAESSLNFLGIGLDPGIPTLGQLVDAARDHMFDKPVLILAPGLTLFVIIIAFNFIGEGLSHVGAPSKTAKTLHKRVAGRWGHK